MPKEGLIACAIAVAWAIFILGYLIGSDRQAKYDTEEIKALRVVANKYKRYRKMRMIKCMGQK